MSPRRKSQLDYGDFSRNPPADPTVPERPEPQQVPMRALPRELQEVVRRHRLGWIMENHTVIDGDIVDYRFGPEAEVVLVDANTAPSVTLPFAREFPNRHVVIKKIDSSATPVTIGTSTDGFTQDYIEGSPTTSIQLTAQWEVVRLVSGGDRGIWYKV